MFQPGLRVIVGIGTVTVDDAGIPRGTGVHRLVPGFLPPAVSVEDRLGPRFSVPEPRLVVLRKYAEDRHAEANRRQLLDARRRDPFRVFKVQPPEMGSVNQQGYAGVYSRHHRLWAHGMYLNQDARLLRLVHDSPEG